MESFIVRHREVVTGALSGFDRLRFRGSLRWLCYADGLGKCLNAMGVKLVEFGKFCQQLSARIRGAAQRIADEARRPREYLASPAESKESRAREIAARDGVREGLICVLHAVEPCQSFRLRKDRGSKRLVLEGALRKCTHEYFYWIHPRWGFGHLRVQTWLPMTLHICLNGREWLARQLDAEGVGYERRDNCFTWIADPAAAQRLMQTQLRIKWAQALDDVIEPLHPHWRDMVGPTPPRVGYYWSVQASEWATDLMFRSAKHLAALYPHLLRHATVHLGSRDVLRFLGRHVPVAGGVPPRFAGEVVSDLRSRPEGMRVKHRVNANSVKMYDKQGSVLRIETTINNPDDMRVYRPREGDPKGPKSWRVMRRGVADMHRRAQISQQANDRYLHSLAAAEHTQPLADLTVGLCQPATWHGRRARGLNPLSAGDARLFELVNRGEYLVNGFRNRDLRVSLFGMTKPGSPTRKSSAAVTRQLRLLRAHGLIRKLPRTHRYVLTDRGHQTINAILAARAADTEKLIRAA